VITLAVVPSTTPGNTPEALADLCRELSTLVDQPVASAHPESYAELASALEKDRVQYAWMPPALLVLTDENTKLAPLLSAVRNDSVDYRSVLFVDAASPFTALADLQGKRVAWVDTASAAGYLFPRVHLATRGFDATTFFGSELFLKSHAEVVRAVLDGRADAGATYAERPAAGPIRRAGFIDAAPGREVRVLEWTRAIPNDVIAGHGLLPKTEHRLFSNAILTLAEREDGRRLLQAAFHADRFMTTPRNALRPLWEHVRLARKHGLLPHL
jgi:phosphonate transport system substrate-binding protein